MPWCQILIDDPAGKDERSFKRLMHNLPTSGDVIDVNGETVVVTSVSLIPPLRARLLPTAVIRRKRPAGRGRPGVPRLTRTPGVLPAPSARRTRRTAPRLYYRGNRPRWRNAASKTGNPPDASPGRACLARPLAQTHAAGQTFERARPGNSPVPRVRRRTRRRQPGVAARTDLRRRADRLLRSLLAAGVRRRVERTDACLANHRRVHGMGRGDGS